MNDKVSFNQVRQYALQHNLDFKTAAQKLGLNDAEVRKLQELGGDPGEPVDGFEGDSAKGSQVMQDLWGGNTWEEAGFFEKAGKIILTVGFSPVLALFGLTGCTQAEPLVVPLESENKTKKEPVINVILNLNTTVEIKPGMTAEDFATALREIFNEYGIDKIGDIAATLKQLGLDVAEITGLLAELKAQQQQHQAEIEKAHAIIIAMLESIVAEAKANGATLAEILTELRSHGASLSDIITVLKNNGETQAAILEGVKGLLGANSELSAKIDEAIKLLREGNKIGANCEDLLGKLLDKNFEIQSGGNVDTAKIEKLLADILEAINKSTAQNKDMDTKTHGLLSVIIDKINDLGAKGQGALDKIINAINSNTEVVKGTQGLVKEILEKMDKFGGNLEAILEVVSKIASNEPVDLSTIQATLDKILNATKNNGDVLNDINDKLNFVGVALEGIKDQIGEGNEAILAKLQQILDKIPEGCKCKEVDLSVIVQKLDDIIVKLQTQNGGNHEGILGDLGDLDSLL